MLFSVKKGKEYGRLLLQMELIKKCQMADHAKYVPLEMGGSVASLS